MSVNLERSKRLTEEISRLEARVEGAAGEARAPLQRRLDALTAERARVDERFDPDAALAGAARYLAVAEDHFGRDDFAAASYHMGIGNLDRVIETYLAPQPPAPTARGDGVAERPLVPAGLLRLDAGRQPAGLP